VSCGVVLSVDAEQPLSSLSGCVDYYWVSSVIYVIVKKRIGKTLECV
jgi:hypothetical protein